MTILKEESFSNNDFNNDEINFKNIYRTFFREKKLILSIILISSFLSIIYSFLKKPLWVGNFNIVVKNETNEVSSSNSTVRNLFNFKKNEENETQKLILKSPSVLMPVYEYVQSVNKRNNIKTTTFKKWITNDLNIDFEDDSSVLKVQYKSKNKKLILETLNLISNKYKDYSKSDTEKNIIKTINYLENQTSLMREKSIRSLKKFNKFSIDNGLGNIDGFVGLGNSQNNFNNNFLTNSNNPFSNNFNNDLNSQISNLNSPNGNIKAGQRFRNQFASLEKYEAEYLELSSKLTPNSKVLSELKDKIDNLRDSLKRPNAILLEYRLLYSKAERDEKILDQLESDLQVAKLQKIKTPDPWEMISTPTLDNKPLYPNKKNNLFITFFISSIFAFAIVFIKVKIEGRIYELNEYLKLIPYSFLETIYASEINLSSMTIQKNVEVNSDNQLAIIYLNDSLFTEEKSNEIPFNKKIINFETFKIKNFGKLEAFKKIILIVEPGKINLKNLDLANKYLSLYKKKIRGWFFVKTNYENNIRNIF